MYVSPIHFGKEKWHLHWQLAAFLGEQHFIAILQQGALWESKEHPGPVLPGGDQGQVAAAGGPCQGAGSWPLPLECHSLILDLDPARNLSSLILLKLVLDVGPLKCQCFQHISCSPCLVEALLSSNEMFPITQTSSETGGGWLEGSGRRHERDGLNV